MNTDWVFIPDEERRWIPLPEQPSATYQQKYQWMWLYGFVHPAEGETYWWILPCVNTSVFNRVLAEFAAE